MRKKEPIDGVSAKKEQKNGMASTNNNNNNSNDQMIRNPSNSNVIACFEELRQSINSAIQVAEFKEKNNRSRSNSKAEESLEEGNHPRRPSMQFEIKFEQPEEEIQKISRNSQGNIAKGIEKKHEATENVQHVHKGTNQEQLISQPRETGDAIERSQSKKEVKTQIIMGRDQHRIPLEDLISRLETDLKLGLTDAEAINRNAKSGDNKLKEIKKQPQWMIFLHEVSNPFALLLWFAAICCLVAWIIDNDPQYGYLAIVLVVVVLATAIVNFVQNKKSSDLMNSFSDMLPSNCTVIRDGFEKRIEAVKLVVGDIVKVGAGEKIPADIRLFSVNEMTVDNSPLTGESEAQVRTILCTHPNSMLETKNVAFFGTLCKGGQGVGIVIHIGDETTLGQIADLTQLDTKPPTPLRVELNRLVIIMVVIAVVLGVLFFFLSKVAIGKGFIESLIFGIGILVSNIPEGLLGCITISLSITAKALHRKNVIVKNLEAVETLGSTSCICTDKTGTLTQNIMSVKHLWLDRKVQEAAATIGTGTENNAEDNAAEGGEQRSERNEEPNNQTRNSFSFRQLQLCAVLSSQASFDLSTIPDAETVDYSTCPVIGDATETGIIRFFQSIEDVQDIRGRYRIPESKEKVLARMPFNSTDKFALTIVEMSTEESDFCIFVKGAPEKIWSLCSKLQVSSNGRQIGENERVQFEQANMEFGMKGERVLGFAKLHLPRRDYPKGAFEFNVSTLNNFNFKFTNLTFLGLLALEDPPKQRVPAAILECRSAGIKVIMVTGDQPLTAASIARQVNIIPQKVKTNVEAMRESGMSLEESMESCDAIVVHGDMIVSSIEQAQSEGKPDNTYLREWVQKPFCVFARTTPAQKLQIVLACQAEGFVCAVTGDGVNDSPAIKQADIGISMNLTGSDVTKDAADMILMDDDFASIVGGIEEGRKIFDNLKKTFVYILCSNTAQIVPFMMFIILGIPLPLTNIFMLIICVGTDIYPAISLASEEAEIDIMTRKPRKKTEHLASSRLMFHSYGIMGVLSMCSGMLSYITVMSYYGFPARSLLWITRLKGYPDLTSEQKVGKCTDVLNNRTKEEINWLDGNSGKIDLRIALVKCDGDQWESLVKWGKCSSQDEISKFTGKHICFTTEASWYAQTAYFLGVIVFQWSNIFACKARSSSFTYTPVNYGMFKGIIFETVLALVVVLTPLNRVLGGRPLPIWLFGIPSFPISILILLWEETRKILIRNSQWFKKHVYW